MLEVVGEHQQLARAQMAREAVGARPVGSVALRERSRDLRCHQRRIRHALQTHKYGAIRVVGLSASADLQRQSGLSHPAGSRKGDDPHLRIGHQRTERGQLAFSPDEPRGRLGQVGFRAAIRRPGLRTRDQGRVVLEDPLLQLGQPLARLEPELDGEQPTRSLIGLQRISLALRAIQGKHQLGPQTLLERMLSRKALELADQLSGDPGGKVGFDAQHGRVQALLLELATPLSDAAFQRDVTQRVTAKQPKRVAQQSPRSPGLGLRLFDKRVKAPHIEVETAGSERVPARISHEQVSKRAAQLRGMHVQCRHRARRRTHSP